MDKKPEQAAADVPSPLAAKATEVLKAEVEWVV